MKARLSPESYESSTSTELSKILIISSSLKLGGIERASSNLANEFARAGHLVYFFCVFRQKPFFSLEKSVEIIEPRVKSSQRLNIIDAPLRIRRAVKKIKPDAILVFNKFYSAQTLLGLAGLKYKIFVSERASPFYRFPFTIEIFNKLVFSIFKPTGVVAQTHFAANKQKEYYKKGTSIKVIPNALREIKKFDVQKRQVVLGVGRLSDHLKGFDLLIDAWSQLKNKQWNLVLTGRMEENPIIEEKVRKYGLENNIEFVGRVNNIDLLYAEAGVFVIPSRSEGFPNALVEAMASGLPVISFNFHTGVEEIITKNHNGILVENGNTKKLAEAIDFLIADEAERSRLGKNAKEIRNRLEGKQISSEVLGFILTDKSFV